LRRGWAGKHRGKKSTPGAWAAISRAAAARAWLTTPQAQSTKSWDFPPKSPRPIAPRAAAKSGKRSAGGPRGPKQIFPWRPHGAARSCGGLEHARHCSSSFARGSPRLVVQTTGGGCIGTVAVGRTIQPPGASVERHGSAGMGVVAQAGRPRMKTAEKNARSVKAGQCSGCVWRTGNRSTRR